MRQVLLPKNAKAKDNKNPSDTLKRGMGTGGDIDLLFAALATAAGFDARIVLAPDRGDLFFNKQLPNAYFVDPRMIAVNAGGTWKFFNPGYNHLPFGMLRWQEEGEQALITDPKQPVWVDTPMTSHEKSRIIRRAKLKLTEDGTLEGEVRIEFSGHSAIGRKELSTPSQKPNAKTDLKDDIKAQISAAEVTNVKIENVMDHVKPLVYSYNIRIPGYAQRTGKRIFVQPAFFQYGVKPLFSSATRKYAIYFHYPWSEDDRGRHRGSGRLRARQRRCPGAVQ